MEQVERCGEEKKGMKWRGHRIATQRWTGHRFRVKKDITPKNCKIKM